VLRYFSRMSALESWPSILTAMRISFALREILREEVVLHVLLGDRRATDLGLAGDARLDGPEDAADRDAVVLVERAVLGGDVGLLDRLRHLLELHRLAVAVLHGDAVELGLAVGVVDDRDLLVGQLVRLRDADPVVGDEHACDADDEERGRDDRTPLEGGDDPSTPPGAAPTLGAPLCGTWLAPALRHNLLRSVMRPEKGPGPPLSMTRRTPQRPKRGGRSHERHMRPTDCVHIPTGSVQPFAGPDRSCRV
jgi:hypothetical protein